MPSLFLHRVSVVRVYLSTAATTQDPAGRDPRQHLKQQVAKRCFFNDDRILHLKRNSRRSRSPPGYQPALFAHNRCHHNTLYTYNPPHIPSCPPGCLDYPLGTCHKLCSSFMSSQAVEFKLLEGKNHVYTFRTLCFC